MLDVKMKLLARTERDKKLSQRVKCRICPVSLCCTGWKTTHDHVANVF